jgi:geranylgeranylglycerol-phosphate geranylgeranyltransferase
VANRVIAGAAVRFFAAARIYRPLNLLAIGVASVVGARLAHAPLEQPGLLVPLLVGAYGYARNDAVDLAADRWNRPSRPLPSGVLTTRAAHRLAMLPLVSGALLVAACDPTPVSVTIAAGSALLLTAYSPWLKERGPFGPAAISLLTALAVVWGALGGVDPARALFPALLAAAAQFARECVKQLEDLPGDRAAARRTWAVRAGDASVRRIARIAILAALVLLPLPATAGVVRPLYLYLAAPLAGIPLAWSLWGLGTDGVRYGRVSASLKASLFAGLAALGIAA